MSKLIKILRDLYRYLFIRTIVVSDRDEFLAMFDKDGIPREPFSLKDGKGFISLQGVRSLKGVTIGEDCRLSQLSGLTTLDGINFLGDARLSELESVGTVNGFNPGRGKDVYLLGLSSIVINPPHITNSELDLLRLIPLDQLAMGSWHCGTTHCLAGWAQVLGGIKANNATVFADGCRLLPSMVPYFYCTDEQVLTYLKTLHK